MDSDDADPEAELTRQLSRLWTETLSDARLLDAADPGITLRPPPQAGPRLPEPDRFALAAEQAGARFELVERIGEGGMGLVWRARQASLLRDVAVKQLKPGDAAAERFLAEAMVTAALDHPNILPVHALGRDGEGNLYLAMKLVRGATWRRLLRPESAADRAAAEAYAQEDHLRILIQVCRAVEYAHSKRLLHRDLKPDNIMVGDYGEVLVVDWGLAVSLARADDDDSSHGYAPRATAVRAPAGTPAYMAPEMALGEHHRLDERADVYLLGAILFEILAGRPPHRGRRLLDVLGHAAAGHPPPLPVDLPAELTDIVYTAMARDPADRHPAAAAFRRAIEDYLAHRESIALAERAEAEAEDLGGEDDHEGDPYRRYERHARVVARYEQALELWPENMAALDGARTARLAYAEAALQRGDLGLAESQLGRMGVDTAEDRRLRSAVIERRNALRRRERTARRNHRLLLIAVAVILLGIAGSAVGSSVAGERVRRAEQTEAAEREARLNAELAEQRERIAAAARAERRMAAIPPFSEAGDLLRRSAMLAASAPDDPARSARMASMAAERLRAALAADPDFIEAQLALGDAERAAGRPQAAAEAYLAADAAGRRQGRPIPAAMVAAGFACDAAGDYRRAEACFIQAESVAPAGEPRTVADCLALTGTALRLGYQERIADALAAARRALEAGPQLWETRFACGLLTHQAGAQGLADPRVAGIEAERHLRAAIALAPRQAEPLAVLANVLSARGDHAPEVQAEIGRLIDRTVAIEPENGSRRVWRAISRLARGDRAGAEADLAAGIKLGAPAPLVAMYRLQAAPDAASALADLDQLAAAGAAGPEHEANRWLLRLRDQGAAVAAVAPAIAWSAAHAHYPRAWVVRVHALLVQGEVPAALATVADGLALAPYHRDLLALDAQLKQIDNRFAEALAACDRFLAYWPDDVGIRLLRLANLIDLRRWDEALAGIDAIARERPGLEAQLAPLRATAQRQGR